ncbi:hypothetical protein RJP21_19730 [Paenibacillus sp. VCA1]|uniref:hypothetical protein n=1 Tax=Paenibacillus sp. VCA1 TaxID=3039148 RepID=UPI0028725620|nr:hypothetical protein [Paenibacillus sp. VCA1]MDR9855849.1 hypothetical protein [Paenibacillus sp. VCA1]
MSVGVFIVDPVDDFERSFTIPVATESFYRKYWVPAIRELNLQWIALFENGVDLEQEDLPAVLGEVSRLKEWAQANMRGDDLEHMLQRLELLETELPKAYRRSGTVVYIG